MAETVLFKRVAIIGIGLIGSSLARVIRKRGLAERVVTHDSNAASMATALRLDIVDETARRLPDAVREADLVVICTPIGTYRGIAEAIAPHLAPGCIVTEVGSVKRAAIAAIAPALPPHVDFVPGHPLAGTENSGPEAGFDTLFDGHWFVITPLPGGSEAAMARVAELWRRAGSMIEHMTAEHHDHVLAITSHVPHLIAYTIVGTANELEEDVKAEVIKFAASGFRDFTRIAGSDPTMWRDVFLYNRDAVLEMLGRLWEDLALMQRAIRVGDGEALFDVFNHTREIRRGVIEAGQHIPPAPKDDDPAAETSAALPAPPRARRRGRSS